MLGAGGCCGIGGRLLHESELACARCLGAAGAVVGRHSLGVGVGGRGLEVVLGFCCLGDVLSAGGGCGLAAVPRCGCAWGGFRQLLPLLADRRVPLLAGGKVYSSCVGGVMLRAGCGGRCTGPSLAWWPCHGPLDLQCRGRGWGGLGLPSRKAWHPGGLGVDSAGPQGRSEWRGRLRGRLVKSQTLGRGKRALKRI